VDDSIHPEYSQGVIAFRRDVVVESPQVVERFLTAWDAAVDALRTNPDDYRDLLIEKGRVPESIQATYEVPMFPIRDTTSPEEWQDVVDWLLEKGLIETPLPYDGSINTEFYTSETE